MEKTTPPVPVTGLTTGRITSLKNVLLFVDTADTAQSANGSTKKITVGDFFGNPQYLLGTVLKSHNALKIEYKGNPYSLFYPVTPYMMFLDFWLDAGTITNETEESLQIILDYPSGLNTTYGLHGTVHSSYLDLSKTNVQTIPDGQQFTNIVASFEGQTDRIEFRVNLLQRTDTYHALLETPLMVLPNSVMTFSQLRLTCFAVTSGAAWSNWDPTTMYYPSFDPLE